MLKVSAGSHKKILKAAPFADADFQDFFTEGKASLLKYYITASAINWINRIRNTMAMGYTVA